MNVNCTSCQTVFRVDPAKVPTKGVRARCSVCSGVFWVRHSAPVEPAPPPPAVSDVVVGPRVVPPTPLPAPPPILPSPPPLAQPGPVVRAAPPERIAPPSPAPPPMTPVTPPAFTSRPPVTTTSPPVHRLAGPAMPPSRPSPSPAALPPSALPAPPATAFRTTVPPAASPPVAPRLGPITTAPVSIEPPARKGRSNPFLSQDPSAKARRLARALISDMVVYHPAKRREGIVNGSLKQLFEEEIRKSWEEYVDQVGQDMAETTPFFNDALNEILADGQLVFP